MLKYTCKSLYLQNLVSLLLAKPAFLVKTIFALPFLGPQTYYIDQANLELASASCKVTGVNLTIASFSFACACYGSAWPSCPLQLPSDKLRITSDPSFPFVSQL